MASTKTLFDPGFRDDFLACLGGAAHRITARITTVATRRPAAKPPKKIKAGDKKRISPSS
jgi:hypothetical protein